MEKIQKDKSYKMKNIMLILEFLLILTFMIASIYLMTNAIIVGVFAHIFFISFSKLRIIFILSVFIVDSIICIKLFIVVDKS